MAFATIPRIEQPKAYLDIAMSQAKHALSKAHEYELPEDKLFCAKKLAKLKIEAIATSVQKQFTIILKGFPRFDELTPFYAELASITLELNATKESLGGLNWANNTLDHLKTQYQRKVFGCKHPRDVASHTKAFIGRVASVVNKQKGPLQILEHARKTIREYPAIKQNQFTVCISGFPNVGKSTLLSKITTAKPKIGDYAFTTTTLNMGYTELFHTPIQIIDTPGTLNRETMNNTELHAHLVMKHLAHVIIYVYDLTGQYPLDELEQLYQEVKKYKKTVFIYLAKTDLIPTEVTQAFCQSAVAYTNAQEMQDALATVVKGFAREKIKKEELAQQQSFTEELRKFNEQ
jgi:nucleolar GTP-binding protein